MSNRLNIQQQAPEAFKAMLNLETAVAESQHSRRACGH